MGLSGSLPDLPDSTVNFNTACIHDDHIIDGRKGHAELGMLPLCGLRPLPPSGRWERRPAPPGACQKPGSGPVYSLTLDGPIESRYQYFTRQ